MNWFERWGPIIALVVGMAALLAVTAQAVGIIP